MAAVWALIEAGADLDGCVCAVCLLICNSRGPESLVVHAGNVESDYLWILDPVDGTTNFTHSYPPFAISVGVLEKGVPVAACICEFAGSQGNWHTRFYTAYKGGGTFVDGNRVNVSQADNVERSLLVTQTLAARMYDLHSIWSLQLLDDLRPATCLSLFSAMHAPASMPLCR